MFCVTKLPYGRVEQREVITDNIIAVADTEDFCIEPVSRRLCMKLRGNILGVTANKIEAYSNAELLETQRCVAAVTQNKSIFKIEGASIVGYNVYYLPKKCVLPFGVTSITAKADSWALRGVNAEIEELFLPPTLECIADKAFDNCRCLQVVHFSEGLRTIGRYNFSNCVALDMETFQLPKTVEEIKGGCFNVSHTDTTGFITSGKFILGYCYDGNPNVVFPENCMYATESVRVDDVAVEHIHIGKRLRYIDENIFNDCDTSNQTVRRGYFKITVDEDNPYYKVQNGVVYDTRTMTAITCDRTMEEVIIPEGIKRIANCFLSYITTVTRVVIPSSVEVIGDSAFSYCLNLQSVKLSNGLKKIGNTAFRHCKLLKEINIPDTVTEVGEGAFKVCHSLEKVKWSKNTTVIANYMFRYCKGLREFVVPEGITQIGKEVFLDCPEMLSLTLPKSLVKISKTALLGNAGNFSGKSCAKITVTCAKGSKIEKAMQNYGIKYISV